jgi:hypothetical protein
MVVMVKRYKNISKKRLPKRVIGLVIIVLLVAAGIFLFIKHRQDTKPVVFQKTSTGSAVNLNPPTKQDKTATEQNKDNVVKQQQQDQMANKDPANNTPVTNTRKPFITYAAQSAQNIEVDGYVSGVFEDGKGCTATFTQGPLKVTGSSTGFKDSDHTTCTPINLPRSSFSQAGTWSVTLSYSSPTGSGTSDARNVTIQ